MHIYRMYGQKYHSILYKNARTLTQAVFFQGLGDPEVYPRPGGEVYVTGYVCMYVCMHVCMYK
jgi:hypothetical protein